jgi:hypothetical protein
MSKNPTGDDALHFVPAQRARALRQQIADAINM